MTPPKNTKTAEVKRRKRWQMIAINVLAVTGACALMVLLGFVNKKQNNSICWKLDVEIEKAGEENFISEESIRSAIQSLSDSIVGIPVNRIDINRIHDVLVKNKSIREASVFTTVDGRCVVKAKQLAPVARIINLDGTGFYLDKDGYTMPLSNQHTAHVPVFTGNISEQMITGSVLAKDSTFCSRSLLDEIAAFTAFISENVFLKAQVEHVFINAEKKFVVIPRVGDHEIVFGDISNLEMKYKKLMAFYMHELPQRNLNKYASINLEFAGQLVCSAQQ